MLRDLYDQHIKNCVELVRKMMSFAPSAGYRATPVIQLSPVFEKNEGGSQVALDGFIKEARVMIAEHYLATEKVYQGALANLGKRMIGNYVPPPPARNEIARMNNALQKA